MRGLEQVFEDFSEFIGGLFRKHAGQTGKSRNAVRTEIFRAGISGDQATTSREIHHEGQRRANERAQCVPPFPTCDEFSVSEKLGKGCGEMNESTESAHKRDQ